jgi:hypothetical protein
MTRAKANRNPKLGKRVGKALTKAAASARKTARMYGTPIYILEGGKIVAKRP